MSYVILDEWQGLDGHDTNTPEASPVWCFTVVTDPKACCIEQFAWHELADDSRCVHDHTLDAFRDPEATLKARIFILNGYEERGSEPVINGEIVVAPDSDR